MKNSPPSLEKVFGGFLKNQVFGGFLKTRIFENSKNLNSNSNFLLEFF